MEKHTLRYVSYDCVHHSKQKKEKKTADEIRKKVITKNGQGKDYKTVSKQLDVLVSTVANIIKKCNSLDMATREKFIPVTPSLSGWMRKKKTDWSLLKWMFTS